MNRLCPLLHAVRAGCAPGTPHVLKLVVGRLAIMNRSSVADARRRDAVDDAQGRLTDARVWARVRLRMCGTRLRSPIG